MGFHNVANSTLLDLVQTIQVYDEYDDNNNDANVAMLTSRTCGSPGWWV